MSNQPEITSYDAGVYQIEATDPVDGGVGAVTNAPLLALSNRTNYLKKHLDDIENGSFVPTGLAPINSPGFSGTPTAPTQAAADSSTKLSNTAFVQAAVNGLVSVSVAGGGTTTLTAAQYGVSTIVLTGAITANKAVVFPALSGHWQVLNKTSGAFSITLKTAAGTGIVVTQGASTNIYGDGTNIGLQQTDFISPDLTGSPTATTPGEADTSARIATMAAVRSAMALFGLGTGARPALPGDDCNNVITSGSYRIAGSTVNNPPSFGNGSILKVEPWNDNTVLQVVYGTPGIAIRIGKIGAWGAWDYFAKLSSPIFTGTPTAPKAAQFATGSQIINADALKAFGNQASNLRSIPLSVTTVTLTAADAGSAITITGSGGGTLNLPLASSVPSGAEILVRAANSSVSTNTLATQGSDTISGLLASATTSPRVLRSGDSLTLVSDGASTWYAFADATFNAVCQQVAAFFTLNQTLSSTGQITLPGGFILQWGTAQISGTLTTLIVTLPKTYPNQNLFAMASDVGATCYPAGADNFSASQVKIYVAPYNVSNGTISAKNSIAAIRWMCIGF